MFSRCHTWQAKPPKLLVAKSSKSHEASITITITCRACSISKQLNGLLHSTMCLSLNHAQTQLLLSPIACLSAIFEGTYCFQSNFTKIDSSASGEVSRKFNQKVHKILVLIIQAKARSRTLGRDGHHAFSPCCFVPRIYCS